MNKCHWWKYVQNCDSITVTILLPGKLHHHVRTCGRSPLFTLQSSNCAISLRNNQNDLSYVQSSSGGSRKIVSLTVRPAFLLCISFITKYGSHWKYCIVNKLLCYLLNSFMCVCSQRKLMQTH